MGEDGIGGRASLVAGDGERQNLHRPRPDPARHFQTRRAHQPLLRHPRSQAHITTLPCPCDVGEQHAYRNATGSLTYQTGATTTITIESSVNDGAWSASGNVTYTASSDFSTGITRGPKASYLNIIDLNYHMEKRTWKCEGNGTVKTWVHRKVVPAGVHTEPDNPDYDPYKLGPSVLYKDGYAMWDVGSYRSSLQRGQGICVSQNKAVGYGIGVTVFGLGLKTQSTHSRLLKQCLTAGHYSIVHRVWGSNSYVWNSPRVFFSY